MQLANLLCLFSVVTIYGTAMSCALGPTISHTHAPPCGRKTYRGVKVAGTSLVEMLPEPSDTLLLCIVHGFLVLVSAPIAS